MSIDKSLKDETNFVVIKTLAWLSQGDNQIRGDKMSIQDNIKADDEEIAAWNAHDVERAAAVFPDEVVWHDTGSPQPMHGKDALRQYLQGWFSAFPDIKILSQIVWPLRIRWHQS